MNRTAILCTSIAGLALIGSAALLSAGPLSPPGGAVAPTHKTLTEVEPRIAVNATNTPGDADSLFVITQPGSYYLTSNITGVAGKHGIKVAAGGVTIDLNGFDLAGVPGSLSGISAATAGSLSVRDGSVRSWGVHGVDLFGTVGSIAMHVQVNGNTGYGIRGSNRTVLKSCVATSNGVAGLRVATGGIIEACCSGTNIGDGIEASTGSLIVGNNCFSNGSVAGDGAGIHVTGVDCRIEGNNCTTSDRGIDVDVAGNIIIRNTCSGNTTNWDIVANNVCGPIVDRSVPGSAAILGNSAPDSTGSTHPNANFSY